MARGAQMRPVEYEDLSQDVQDMIAALEVKVDELWFEAKFYRVASFVTFALLAEWVWSRFFS